MKTLIKAVTLIAIMGSISINSIAQKTDGIPQAALKAFSAKYPQAQVKKWKEKKDAYLVFFTMNNKKYQASYSKDGNWLITERDISRVSGLPDELRSYLKTSSYASWNIDDMKKVHIPGRDTYEVFLDNHSGSPFRYEDAVSADDRMLTFDVSGKLLNVKEL